ncbi:MAG: carboxypeptidase regulatory-like domain-containing protein [Candidatus Thermoplasmatota archaeon]|nr:carboxypeptidase regulatory-like domain-containing protein [Candidatus Thermoplasmatota archaeon]
MNKQINKYSEALVLLVVIVGACAVPSITANYELADDKGYSTIGDGPFDTTTVLQQIMTRKEYARDFQLLYVYLDWTDGYHSLDKSTLPTSEGYYTFYTAPGLCNISANAIITNENGTIFPMNATGDFLIDEQPSVVWKNITLTYPNHTATIIGHVYDNESTPLTQAEVDIIYYDPQYNFYGYHSTVTNDTGYYELQLPPSLVSILYAQAEGYEPGVEYYFMIGEETQVHDFFLTPLPPPLAQYIKGHIRDNTTLEPISYASVTIQDVTNYYLDSTSTNVTGYYEFNVPIGNYTVTAKKNNYFTNSTFIQIEENDERWVDINLDAFMFPNDSAWVEGFISESGRGTLENVEITVEGSFCCDFTRFYFTRDTLSDQNGYYNVSVPAIPNMFPLQYSEIQSIDATLSGYFYNSTQYSYPESIIEPGDVVEGNISLDLKPEETCLIQGYVTLSGWNPTPPVNTPPFTPSNPNPLNGQIPVPLNHDLSWTGGDPDQGDIVTYDIYFGTTNPPPQVVWKHPSTLYDPGLMNEETVYYWQIIAWDTHNASTTGPIWSFTTGQQLNTPPTIDNEFPINESTSVSRPPDELRSSVDDLDGDPVDVYVRWKDHTGTWVTLASYVMVGPGIYTYTPPNENDWIWGNTTYRWSVNVTDGVSWTNKTYTYTTAGARYDVNNNNIVNFQDAGLVWVHRTSSIPYDGLYDVNGNGVVNFQDAGLTWVNRE